MSVELVNEWITWQQRERGRSTTTLYSYSKDAERLLMFLRDEVGVSLVDACTADLRGWVHAPLVKGRRAGLSPGVSTLRRRVAMLRSLYGFLCGEGVVAVDPSVRLAAPSQPDEAPKPVNLGVWRALWGSGLSDADRLAFGLGLFCGLRRHEIVSILCQHFGSGGMLSGFPRKGQKSGSVPWVSCVRFFFEQDPTLFGGSIDSFLEPLEKALSERPEDALLLDWADNLRRTSPRKYRPNGLDPTHVNRHLDRALRMANISVAVTPHQLRHGFCTFLVEHGVPLLDVSRLAGHRSVTVTQRYVKTADDPLAGLLGGRSTSLVSEDSLSDIRHTDSEGVVSFGRF